MCLTYSAGLGVLSMAAQAASRMAGNCETAATNQFFLVDKDVGFCTTLLLMLSSIKCIHKHWLYPSQYSSIFTISKETTFDFVNHISFSLPFYAIGFLSLCPLPLEVMRIIYVTENNFVVINLQFCIIYHTIAIWCL